MLLQLRTDAVLLPTQKLTKFTFAVGFTIILGIFLAIPILAIVVGEYLMCFKRVSWPQKLHCILCSQTENFAVTL